MAAAESRLEAEQWRACPQQRWRREGALRAGLVQDLPGKGGISGGGFGEGALWGSAAQLEGEHPLFWAQKGRKRTKKAQQLQQETGRTEPSPPRPAFGTVR